MRRSKPARWNGSEWLSILVDKVVQVIGTVQRAKAGSGRLRNLQIQAEHAVGAEQSLSLAGALTDYEFELDGQRYTKGFPRLDAAAAGRDRQYRAAIDEYPDSTALRLNYGQFLLANGFFNEANGQFQVAEELDPGNATALTGLGLSLCHRDGAAAADRALEYFQRAQQAAPRDFQANLNLAICLNRLERNAEARHYFEQSLELCKDSALKDRIERELARQ